MSQDPLNTTGFTSNYKVRGGLDEDAETLWAPVWGGRPDLTDGEAEIKASTRISEASDTLGRASRVSEDGDASLSLSGQMRTAAREPNTKATAA